jgi:hypothetical protein
VFQWRNVFQDRILVFEIRLDKNTYEAGEIAKGNLFVKADKNLRGRKIKFLVCGKERYVHGMVGALEGDDSEGYDIFFSEDLTPHLKPTHAILQAGDNNMEFRKGTYAIPFHFSIPNNALESYHGKDARIFYEVEVYADMGRWKRHYRRTQPFVVSNPKMDYRIGDRYYLDNEQRNKKGRPYLDMELEIRDGAKELPKFNPGEIIRGTLKLGNIEQTRVNKAIVELQSIEYARWGRPRTVFDCVKKQVPYDHIKDKDTFAFEMQIPQNAKRSFNANHSEYYWLLEAKVDIDAKRDIRMNRVIQIV